MIFPPKSYQCLECFHLFQIVSESFSGEPFTNCEKCRGLAERVDHSYLSNKDKAKGLRKVSEEVSFKPVCRSFAPKLVCLECGEDYEQVGAPCLNCRSIAIGIQCAFQPKEDD